MPRRRHTYDLRTACFFALSAALSAGLLAYALTGSVRLGIGVTILFVIISLPLCF